MGWWDALFPGIGSYQPAQTVLPEPYEPFVGTAGIPVADPGVPLSELTRLDIERYWRTQPNLRRVVGFIARNVAGVPLHLYDRKGDNDRVRVHSGPLASALRSPGKGQNPFRLWESVIADGCLYDRWAIQVLHDANDGSVDLIRLPAWRLRFQPDRFGRVGKILFWTGPDNDITLDNPRVQWQWKELDLETVVYDHGFAPRTAGLSPVATLASLLEEQNEATGYRRELLTGGPRVPAWVERPKDAPRWKDEAQKIRFVEGLRDYARGGKRAGGWPLIEDGMRINDRKVITPSEASDVPGREWSNIEVTTAYFISPEIVGARAGSFASVDAFRQMLYGPQLGPYIEALESAVNAQLVPILEPRASTYYIEANVESKLRGSFLEQAQVMQSATGAPWMLRNEARAMFNRPPVEDGDELVVPLNVLVGGLASPRDTSPNRPERPATVDDGEPAEEDQGSAEEDSKAAPPPRLKASVIRRQFKKAERELAESQYDRALGKFFRDQAAAVKSQLGRKTPEWWDEDRWDKDLTSLLLSLHLATSTRAARAALEAAGVDPDEYDPDRTVNYLTAVARNSGKSINQKTLEDLQDALADDEDPDAAVDAVLDGNTSWRKGMIVAGAVTTAIGFGVHEAASQGRAATKTWIVTSGNPRPEHAAMDGETVPVNEDFSNGMAWPGDPSGTADDLAGCTCELVFNY